MVDVDTVLVEVVVNTVGLAEDAVKPVDFRVGVTVAEGFVKAAGLLILSTKGLMGIVTADADVPPLLGRGRGLEEGSSATLDDCTGVEKNVLLDGTGDKVEFCLPGNGWLDILLGIDDLTGDMELIGDMESISRGKGTI